MKEVDLVESYTLPAAADATETGAICYEIMDELLNNAFGIHILERTIRQ